MQAPKVFISYSHDSEEHKRWVLNLAVELINNGVDVTLDQFDLRHGSDLSHFMEQGLSTSERVVVVSTDPYVEKANAGKGGVGYEKMIITSEIYSNQTTDKFIPLVKNVTKDNKLPLFMGNRLYVDFTNPKDFNKSLESLLREIHNKPIVTKPPVGNSPFADIEQFITFVDEWELDELQITKAVIKLEKGESIIPVVQWPERLDEILKLLSSIATDIEKRKYIPDSNDPLGWNSGPAYVYDHTIKQKEAMTEWMKRATERIPIIWQGMKSEHSIQSFVKVIRQYLKIVSWEIQRSGCLFILMNCGKGSKYWKTLQEIGIQKLHLEAQGKLKSATAKFLNLSDNYYYACVRKVDQHYFGEPGLYVVGEKSDIESAYYQSEKNNNTVLDFYFSHWMMPQIEAMNVCPFGGGRRAEGPLVYREKMYIRRLEDKDLNTIEEHWDDYIPSKTYKA